MHAPGIDITGMTFAGVGPAVLIGRGNGYAWTTTTGSSDLTDTYVERLNPENPRQYLYKGRWEPMECRTEEYVAKGVAELETQDLCRTRHGPIASFDEANDVAYSSATAGWIASSARREGSGASTAAAVSGATGRARRCSRRTTTCSTWTTAGTSATGIPATTRGGHRGVDLRLPQDGTGRSEWRGLLPVQRVPHAVNFKRGWLVNWNNLPAKGWRRERSFDARDGVDDLSDPYYDRRTADPEGGRVRGRRWDFDALSAQPAPRGVRRPRVRLVRERPATGQRPAVGDRQEGARGDRRLGRLQGRPRQRRAYDSAGYTILRAWIPQLRQAAFADELGEEDLGRARSSTELWHVFSPDSTHGLRTDWLNGKDRRRRRRGGVREGGRRRRRPSSGTTTR